MTLNDTRTTLELLATERDRTAILRAEVERIRESAHAACDDLAGKVLALREMMMEETSVSAATVDRWLEQQMQRMAQR